MKLFLVSLVLVTTAFASAELTRKITEANIEIDLPNDSWFLADKQTQNGTGVYFFKRNPVADSEGRQIIPNIAVIVEDVEEGTDAIAYSALKRLNVGFKVLKVHTHEDGLINFQNAIAYKGSYVDQGKLDHTIYIVHGINGDKGLQIIFDATTDVFDKVEGEFLTTLKSIRK